MEEANMNPEEMFEEKLINKKLLHRAPEINIDVSGKRTSDHVAG